MSFKSNRLSSLSVLDGRTRFNDAGRLSVGQRDATTYVVQDNTDT